VLDPLCGADERGIAHGIRRVQVDGLAPFLHQALHGGADLRPRLFVQFAKHLFQALHVGAGLLQVGFKAFLQLGIAGSLGHFWQGLHQLLFGVVEILDFVDQEFAKGGCFRHDDYGFWMAMQSHRPRRQALVT
jgi:hypothetical protein